MQRTLWFSLLLLVLVPGVLFAQSGKIHGKVVDAKTNEPLVGANIIVGGTTKGAITDIEGSFVILNVPVGTYSIKASYVGYQTMTITNLRVNAELTTEANFPLSSQEVQVQAVEIVAERPLINKSATNAISIVDNEIVQQMPVRNLTSVFALQTGVVQQGVDANGNANLYIRGSRADEVGFQVDGVSINNVYNGGRAVSINQEAVEQIQVQTGGYPAEYGGANGGLINMQLKTGKETLHATLQAETDNYTSQGEKSLGGYSYGFSDYVGTLSGPLLNNKIRFFASVENQFYRDPAVRYWDGFNFSGDNNLVTAPGYTAAHPPTGANPDPNSFPDTVNAMYQAGNLLGGQQNDYTYTGTLLFDMNKLQIRTSGSYHTRNARTAVGADGDIFENVLNMSRLPLVQNSDGFFNLKATEFLSEKTYIEANFNYFSSDRKTMDPYFKENFALYDDSVANQQYGITMRNSTGGFYLPWQVGGGGATTDATLNKPGTLTTGFAHTAQNSVGGRLDFFSQSGNHAVKIGGEYSYYTFRRYSINTSGVAAMHATTYDTASAIEKQSFLFSTVNNIGYDALGNEIDADQYVGGDLFNLGPRHPQFGAVYIQDKIELSDIVLNIGLRYDYINADNIQYKNPSNVHVNSNLGVVYGSDIEKAPATEQISPRLGFGFPVTDKTMFHAQYGKFIQQSQLSDSYLGLGLATYYITGGNFIQFPVGYGLKPERSTQYEGGFSQQISDNASFDITAFYKDVQDAVQYATILPAGGANMKAYPALINGDFSTSKGVEVKFTMRRNKRLQMQANYTYTNGEGTGSSNSDLAGASYNGYIPKMIFPFSYNQAHTGNISLDYRFDKNDGGPILQRLGINLLFTVGSGYNFTQENVSGNLYGNSAETDVRNRIPIEEIGASTTSATYELDLRIDKTVSLGTLDANIYIYVINLLNTQNVVSAFNRTGDAADDGWLSSTAGQQEAQGAVNPVQYAALYQASYLGNNTISGAGSLGSNYSVPRQIRFGMKLEF